MSSPNYNFTKILVTGGSGGLGLALSKLFLSKGKVRILRSSSPSPPIAYLSNFNTNNKTQKVVVAGRTESSLEDALKTLSETYPGQVSTSLVDLQNIKHFPEYVSGLLSEHPDLDAVCLNAGIQKPIDYTKVTDEESVGKVLKDSDDEISTNILSVVHFVTALLPHLLKKENAVVCTVSSGLAFVPIKPVPV